jgi:hypothetical protein
MTSLWIEPEWLYLSSCPSVCRKDWGKWRKEFHDIGCHCRVSSWIYPKCKPQVLRLNPSCLMWDSQISEERTCKLYSNLNTRGFESWLCVPCDHIVGPKHLWRYVIPRVGNLKKEKFPFAQRGLRYGDFGSYRVLGIESITDHSSGQSPASHRNGLGSIPRQITWDLWWTKRHRDGISPTDSRSIKFLHVH